MDFRTPDYRAQAEKCLELSARAHDRQTKLHWMMMAKACAALADEQEKDDPPEVWGDFLYPGQPISQTRH